MTKILFVCIHNSGRSQMAEAFANRIGRGVLSAQSAGTKPTDAVNPVVVQAMQEVGYNMSGHYPKIMTDGMLDTADLVVTMGCGVNLEDVEEGAVCPAVLTQTEDWNLDDPKGKSLEDVRIIRDQIKAKVEELVDRFRK
jgi:protein-tyrosine-phosphatase